MKACAMAHTQSHTPSDQRATSREAEIGDIRRLNDEMREELECLSLTVGIRALGVKALIDIARKIRTFRDFTEENDPWGEHDFGAFDYEGHKIFWKIDYCDRSLRGGSPDPTDPTVTKRVLTVMLADEY